MISEPLAALLPTLPSLGSYPQALFYVRIFGMLVGWFYVTVAFYLQYNRRFEYPWQFPALYFSMGLGIILIANAVLIPTYLVSIVISLVGYILIGAVAINTAIWVVVVYPHRYAISTEATAPSDADLSTR